MSSLGAQKYANQVYWEAKVFNKIAAEGWDVGYNQCLRDKGWPHEENKVETSEQAKTVEGAQASQEAPKENQHGEKQSGERQTSEGGEAQC